MADGYSRRSHPPPLTSAPSSNTASVVPSPIPSYDRFSRIPLRNTSGASTPHAPAHSQPSTPAPGRRDFAFTPLTANPEKPTKVFDREPPSSPLMGSYNWWRLKRLATRPLPWAIVIVVGLITWWGAGASTDFDSEDMQSRLRELFPPEFTRELQFYPASNHKIHVSIGKRRGPKVLYGGEDEAGLCTSCG